MKRWRVYFSIGAGSVAEVEADTADEAMDKAESPASLCHQCARHLSLGDAEPIEAEEITGEH